MGERTQYPPGTPSWVPPFRYESVTVSGAAGTLAKATGAGAAFGVASVKLAS